MCRYLRTVAVAALWLSPLLVGLLWGLSFTRWGPSMELTSVFESEWTRCHCRGGYLGVAYLVRRPAPQLPGFEQLSSHASDRRFRTSGCSRLAGSVVISISLRCRAGETAGMPSTNVWRCE